MTEGGPGEAPGPLINKERTAPLNKITNDYIIGLLTNYRSNKRRAIQLAYELENRKTITPDEMLEALALSRPFGEVFHTSQLSDKTFRTALNYQAAASKENDQVKESLISSLLPLLQELDRLEHYICALDPKQYLVITRLFFDRHSQSAVAEELTCSVRTVRYLKQAAIETLVEMYQFAQSAL